MAILKQLRTKQQVDTQEQFCYAVFDALNEALFNSELQEPYIELDNYRQSDGTILSGCFLKPGEDSRYPSDKASILISYEVADEITSNSETSGNMCEAIADTMAHEMLHYWNYLQGISDYENDGTHNEAFRDAARQHLVDCEKGVSGWSCTGISWAGWFELMDAINLDEWNDACCWDGCFIP